MEKVLRLKAIDLPAEMTGGDPVRVTLPPGVFLVLEEGVLPPPDPYVPPQPPPEPTR